MIRALETRNERIEEEDTRKNEFEGFLADAYEETSKFLEKIEKFQRKTVFPLINLFKKFYRRL